MIVYQVVSWCDGWAKDNHGYYATRELAEKRLAEVKASSEIYEDAEIEEITVVEADPEG